MSTSREEGVWRGRSIARVFQSPDGMTVLVGKSAVDNDTLSLRLAKPDDFWFHAAGHSGAHVVVLNPARLDRLSRETMVFAAALAAGYSGGRRGGRVAVHSARCADVRKPPGFESGKVHLRRYRVVQAVPLRD